MNVLVIATIVMASSWTMSAVADSAEARCDIYPTGQDHASAMLPCTFSQRQGYITITRQDGVSHELAPTGDAHGNFRDQHDRTVYREAGLDDQGAIFRFPDQAVYVYWDISALQPASAENNPTAPFSTADYDATALLRCRASQDGGVESCPAGILRMENGQASVVVLSPGGEQFTINFMRDYINATDRSVEGALEGDTWIVTVDGREVYEVPLAAIEGG